MASFVPHIWSRLNQLPVRQIIFELFFQLFSSPIYGANFHSSTLAKPLSQNFTKCQGPLCFWFPDWLAQVPLKHYKCGKKTVGQFFLNFFACVALNPLLTGSMPCLGTLSQLLLWEQWKMTQRRVIELKHCSLLWLGSYPQGDKLSYPHDPLRAYIWYGLWNNFTFWAISRLFLAQLLAPWQYHSVSCH